MHQVVALQQQQQQDGQQQDEGQLLQNIDVISCAAGVFLSSNALRAST
jgi:hypothetical protein